MLLLRKECQVILNKAGLNDLHINVRNRYVHLVGKCGQDLMCLNGINFSKTSISVVEREYAVELIQEFVDKHGVKIAEYIKAKKQAGEKPLLDVTTIHPKLTLSGSTVYYMATSKISLCYFTDKGKISMSSRIDSIHVDKVIEGLQEAKQIQKEIVKAYKEVDAWNYKQTALRLQKAELIKCDI